MDRMLEFFGKLLESKQIWAVSLAVVFSPIMYGIFDRSSLLSGIFFQRFGRWSELLVVFCASLIMALVLEKLWESGVFQKLLNGRESTEDRRRKLLTLSDSEKEIMLYFWSHSGSLPAKPGGKELCNGLAEKGLLKKDVYQENGFMLSEPIETLLKEEPWLLGQLEVLEAFAGGASNNPLLALKISKLIESKKADKEFQKRYRELYPYPPTKTFLNELALIRANYLRLLKAEYPNGWD